MKDQLKKVCIDAVETFGKDKQVDIAIEEMSELIKALLKDRRYGQPSNQFDVCEEIADVIICINQLCLLFDHGLVNFQVKTKLERLQKLVNEKKEG